MTTSYIDEIKERARKLLELIERKSSGRAILLPVTKGFGVMEVQAMLEVGLIFQAKVQEHFLLEQLNSLLSSLTLRGQVILDK